MTPPSHKGSSSRPRGHLNSLKDCTVPTIEVVDSLGNALSGVKIGSESVAEDLSSESGGCSRSQRSHLEYRNVTTDRICRPPTVNGRCLSLGENIAGNPYCLPSTRGRPAVLSSSCPDQNTPLLRENFVSIGKESAGHSLSQCPSLGEDLLKLRHAESIVPKASARALLANTVTSGSNLSNKHAFHPGLSGVRSSDLLTESQGLRMYSVHATIQPPSCSVAGSSLPSGSGSLHFNGSDVNVGRFPHAYHKCDLPKSRSGDTSSYTCAPRGETGAAAVYQRISSGKELEMDRFDGGESPNFGRMGNVAFVDTCISKDAADSLGRSCYETIDDSPTVQCHHGDQHFCWQRRIKDHQGYASPAAIRDGRSQALPIAQLPLHSSLYVPGAETGGAVLMACPSAGASSCPPSPATHVQNYFQPFISVSTGGCTQSGFESNPTDHFVDAEVCKSRLDDCFVTSNDRDPFTLQRSSSFPDSSDAIAALYSAPCPPPLDALLGHVRRLSRDQLGCRLLQQALDEEGPMCATLILNEGLPFWAEAMVDPFGNYLFQKILEKITLEERFMLVKNVSRSLVNASLNLHGTRSVQKLIELCAADELAFSRGAVFSDVCAVDILTRSLAPAAARLCIDSHGNHVIQRVLLDLGHAHSRFVFEAVAAGVGDIARHRHGCCVIQRCLDSPPSRARSHLIQRIVEKTLELMQDAYGNYVVQYVLEVCGNEQVHAVCESVVGKVNLLAIQKFSSNVMEKCFERCTERVKELYVQELSDPVHMWELMTDPFGNYVVQRALCVATHDQAVRLVEAMRPHLILLQPGTFYGRGNGNVKNTAGGRRIMAKICRRFPNFRLCATGSTEDMYSQHKRCRRELQRTSIPPPSVSQWSRHELKGEKKAKSGHSGLPGSHNHTARSRRSSNGQS